MAAIRVGLIGAGPWARIAYVPLLTGGPELELAAVWARRPEAANEVAALGGTTPAASVEELLDRCDAVAFAVPPNVQWEMAIQAAKAGKHLLLDKPVGDTAEHAGAVADAVAAAGVASIVMFTSRFRPDVRRLLAETSDATYAQLLNLNGAFLAGPFSDSPWRHAEGALLDWGPHGVDMLMAALGPVVSGFAQERDGTFAVTLQHDNGHASQALVSSTWSGTPVSRLDLVTPQGLRSTDWAKRDPATYEQVFRTVREEFAHAVRTGEPHPCDARRGAEVQRVVDELRSAVAQNG
ncbi:MAG TPA: Gfo/Idh/MocA family oxidoreductase [Mycobacteriales bacterium]|nr:Gfo/Idh/MocA family oxidoreductase [Mycobacteriales bacterium]